MSLKRVLHLFFFGLSYLDVYFLYIFDTMKYVNVTGKKYCHLVLYDVRACTQLQLLMWLFLSHSWKATVIVLLCVFLPISLEVT